MKKLLDKLKVVIDAYKIWIFALALFGLGTTAYFSNSSENSSENESEAEDIPSVEKEHKINSNNITEQIEEHLKEHHGGI